MKLNGHGMSTLIVPEGGSETYLSHVIGRFLNCEEVISQDAIGRVWADDGVRVLATTHTDGGKPLYKPYTGQSFILNIPTSLLNQRGLEAAQHYERNNK